MNQFRSKMKWNEMKYISWRAVLSSKYPNNGSLIEFHNRNNNCPQKNAPSLILYAFLFYKNVVLENKIKWN